MIYLIDGHNLIGKLPDIQLSDPDDEEKLVRRLQSWARLDRKRKIQVVFDAGKFGGFGDLLSGLNVDVRFSRMGQTADSVLIRQIKKIRNPQEYTLISSDREIISVAKKRRVGYILSEEFVLMLEEDRKAMKAESEAERKALADPSVADDLDVSHEEVDEWLDIFAKAPKPKRPERPLVRPVIRAAEPPPAKKKPKGPPPTTDDLKAGEADLTRDELQSWLDVFAEAPVVKKEPSTDQSAPKRPKPKKRPSADPQASETDKFGQDKLSKDDVDEWMRWFGDGKE